MAPTPSRFREIVIDGALWRVYEQDAFHPDASPCLIFLGPGVARRVRTYPADWFDLSDDALVRLSERW